MPVYLLYWMCIYSSSGQTEHDEILSFKLNQTLKVKFNQQQNW